MHTKVQEISTASSQSLGSKNSLPSQYCIMLLSFLKPTIPQVSSSILSSDHE